jgi:hypothetical protein
MQSRSLISFHLNVLNVSYSSPMCRILIFFGINNFGSWPSSGSIIGSRDIGKIETQESGILS